MWKWSLHIKLTLNFIRGANCKLTLSFWNNFYLLLCYRKTNVKTTEVTLNFLNSKYGEYTTKTKTPNSSGFAGKVYEFKTTFGIVVLEEFLSTRNRVIFTKTEYSWKFLIIVDLLVFV